MIVAGGIYKELASLPTLANVALRMHQSNMCIHVYANTPAPWYPRTPFNIIKLHLVCYTYLKYSTTTLLGIPLFGQVTCHRLFDGGVW